MNLNNPKDVLRLFQKPKSLRDVELRLVQIRDMLQLCIEEIDRVNAKDFEPENEMNDE